MQPQTSHFWIVYLHHPLSSLGKGFANRALVAANIARSKYIVNPFLCLFSSWGGEEGLLGGGIGPGF
jgi:hypothetical protein